MKERSLDNLHDSIEHYLNIAGQKIVQRGRAYYRDGNILTLELLENGNFNAEVEGSDDVYNVSVTVDKNNKIARCECGCPYEYGPVCKHTAAVLMAIRDGKFQKKTVSETKPADFREVILHADEAQLRQVITDYAEQDETFRNRLLASLGSLPEDQVFNEIKRKLDKAVRKFQSDQYQYTVPVELDFKNTVDEILDSASDYMKKGYNVLTFKTAVYVIRSAIVIVDETYECSEDIYDLIYYAEDLLRQSAETVNEAGSEQEQKEICRYGLAEAKNCGDRCDGILRALIPMGVRWIPGQMDAAISRLMISGVVSLDFRLEYLRTVKGDAEYVKYLSANLGIDRIRTLMIRYDLEHGNYAEAETLCRDRLAEEQSPYSRREWLRLLYETYEASQNTDGMTETAKQLLLSGEEKYYDILKDLLVKSGKWEKSYESLSEELAQKLPIRLYEEILMKEKEYRILLDLIETADGSAIFRYGLQIAEEYRDEAAMVYRAKIEELAEEAGDRNKYQEICRYLRELMEIAGPEIVRAMIADFRIRYKRRRSFMEELTGVEKTLESLEQG